MLSRLKRSLVFIIPAIVLLVCVMIEPFLLRTPVPTETYNLCLQAAQKNSNKNTGCEQTETFWQASLSDPAAYNALWITIFTAVLAYVGVIQWVLIGRQIRLSENEFNATHRPKIITRFFRVNTTERGVDLEYKTNVFFHIVNEGSANATVTEIGTRVFNWQGPYTKGAQEIEFNIRPSSSILEAGQEVPIYTEHTFPRKIVLASQPESENDIWWCIGYIKYNDASGVGRVTGFCRKWNFKAKTWDREPNDDWEYSY